MNPFSCCTKLEVQQLLSEKLCVLACLAVTVVAWSWANELRSPAWTPLTTYNAMLSVTIWHTPLQISLSTGSFPVHSKIWLIKIMWCCSGQHRANLLVCICYVQLCGAPAKSGQLSLLPQSLLFVHPQQHLVILIRQCGHACSMLMYSILGKSRGQTTNNECATCTHCCLLTVLVVLC